ncbi:MAG TPA: glycosyl hydrolase family 28-related protein [Candidatus Acidoferrum sp.]|nr:glycosyl hydrolase family 28-related protein [Candidatus Acidoferrum sp.]
MARLPQPGGDAGDWAHILNNYLAVSHNPDGTLRKNAVAAATSLITGTIGLSDLKTINPPTDQIQNFRLSNDGSNLVWRRDTVLNVQDFGALGDGVTDDTAAIQAAIDAASMGGAIVLPRGIYMVTGLKLKAHGTHLVGGARWGTRLVRLGGTQPLVDMSGIGSINNHLKYCGLTDIMLNGNNMPGVLVRSYYADNHIFQNTSFIHCAGLAVDLIETWDTRFDNCSWEDCGSSTDPALLLRNSMPSGTFGFSTDNTNQIHFLGCRWESWRNGAVRLEGSANGSTNQLNGIFFVSCKMESRFVAGSAFQIMEGTTMVFVNQLYIAIDSQDTGFTTPIDTIDDHGMHVFMTDVYIQWGTTPGMCNSLIHMWRGDPHMYHEICSFMPNGNPVTANIIVEPPCGQVMVSCLWANGTSSFVGNVGYMLQGGPTMGYMFPIDNTGVFHVISSISGNDMIKVDNNTTRPAFEVVNAVDTVGFSDNYTTEKWRIIGATGAARFASGKFQIDGNKGYIGINATPVSNISMLIKPSVEGDRGLAVVRPTSTSTLRLMEFQDETFNIQGLSIDSNGRPVAVGTPPRVTAGAQVSYANPGIQVRDIAGNITAAVRPSPTAPGTIASLTFSRPYAATPLSITLSDNSAVAANLYISARSTTGFTVSTRVALQGGSLLNFDYVVIA